MSTKALSWVWEHSPADGSRLLLHLALADEARDDGYISGKEFGSLSRLQDKCRFASRQTIVDARDWLASHDQLLVQTPADRGWGRHNEYVIIMGRDATELARSIGWSPNQQRSDSQTDQQMGGAPTSSARSTESDTIRRTDVANGAHRGAQAAPPAKPVGKPAEPVDGGPTEVRETVRSADRTNRETGPGPVQDRSTEPDATQDTQAPQDIDLTSAHETQPGCSSAAVRETGDVLDDVRRRLASLAPLTTGVRWDITGRQRVELTVHGLAWPDREQLVDDWVMSAAGEVEHRNGAPFSARAWVASWLALTPPAITDDEPLCLEHPVGDIAVPERVCAPCRTALVAS